MLKTLAFAATILYANAQDVITYSQLDGALHRINPADKFQHVTMKGKTSETSKGSINYSTMTFENTTIGNAAVNVIVGKNVSLVVENVTMAIPPTKFTANKGIMHCTGVMHGIITGAASAASAVIEVVDELDMRMMEQEAGLLQDAVVTIEHTLDGLCGLIEDLLKDLLGLIGTLINDLLGDVIPDIVQGMLGELVKDALGMGEKGVILSKTIPLKIPMPKSYVLEYTA